MVALAPKLVAFARRIELFTAAALCSIACASAPRNAAFDKYPATVRGQTSVTYYDVHGRTYDELRDDMRRAGRRALGASFVGETRSPMKWNWRIERSGRAFCSIRDVTVSVSSQITLPRWTAPADPEPGLVTEWNRFITALEAHESGHKDISAKAGDEIVNRLRGFSGLCSQINSSASDIAREIVQRATDEQAAYDNETRHGATQGTTFTRPLRR
jgi:predicted secreted Zn-dependent protease